MRRVGSNEWLGDEPVVAPERIETRQAALDREFADHGNSYSRGYRSEFCRTLASRQRNVAPGTTLLALQSLSIVAHCTIWRLVDGRARRTHHDVLA